LCDIEKHHINEELAAGGHSN